MIPFFKNVCFSISFFLDLFFYNESQWPKHFIYTKQHNVKNKRESGLRVYFINHATTLIQVDGYNILTDPVWADIVGVWKFGIKRITNPGIDIVNLPDIDYVLISHNHYDHLCINTLKILRQKSKNTKFIVPDKVEQLLFKHKFEKKSVIRMKWWEERIFKNQDYTSSNLHVTCVPAKHFSGRGLFDRNKTLWAGFVIEVKKYRIYFAGDTGFSQLMFNAIASKFNSFDICLIPIGAYLPRKIMQKVHIDPSQAVKVHKILNSKKSIGIHYGTFRLSLESIDQPEKDLKHQIKLNNLPQDAFICLKHGHSYHTKSN